MKVLKRVMKSITNLKKRTIILTLLFLVVLTFLISGTAVQQSLKEVLNKNRDKVNSIVSISLNLDAIMQDMMGTNTGLDNSKQIINEALAKKVKESKYVKDYSVQAKENVFTQFSSKDEDPQMGGYVPADTQIAILDSMNKQVSAFNIELLEGELPKESKKQTPVIISKSYADEYKLKIGDKLTLESQSIDLTEKGKTFVTVVSGIYRLTADNPDVLKRQEKNTLYSNEKLVNDIKQESIGGQGLSPFTGYEKIKVELKKPEDVEKFIEEVKSGGGDFKWIEFNSSYNEFKSISQMIDKLINMFKILKLIIFIVAGIIISLVMLLSLRERKKEIGLLLALGEKKINILSQMFFEVAVILVVTFVLSFGLSQFVTTPLAVNFVNEEMQTTVSEKDTSTSLMKKGPNYIEDTSTKLEAETSIDEKEKVDIKSTMIIFLTTLAITALSTIIPSYRLLKKSPTTILSNNE